MRAGIFVSPIFDFGISCPSGPLLFLPVCVASAECFFGHGIPRIVEELPRAYRGNFSSAQNGQPRRGTIAAIPSNVNRMVSSYLRWGTIQPSRRNRESLEPYSLLPCGWGRACILHPFGDPFQGFDSILRQLCFRSCRYEC